MKLNKRRLYIILGIFQILVISLSLKYCESKEVELTNEWHLLQENETLPKGVHVKMDMTTGEKWVKLADKNDKKEGGMIVSEKNVDDKIVESVLEADGSLSILPDADEDVKEKNEYIGEDVMTIHRTLSQLPKDEQDRIGGLPELPALPGSTSNITKQDYEKFELKLKEIWEKRQEELKQAQDEIVADVPSILMDRIKAIRSFIDDGSIVNRTEGNDSRDSISELLFILKELEYDLSDIDMSRDFYTLGGWDILVSLLLPDTHKNANRHNDASYPMDKIQTTVAWVMGTAVKNTDEFQNWIIQPFTNSSSVPYNNTLELLLSNTIACSKKEGCKVDKYIYAIGSALRGNSLIIPSKVTLSILDSEEKKELSLESILYNVATSSLQNKQWNTISKLLLLLQDLNLLSNKEWCTFIQSSIEQYTLNMSCLDRSFSWQEKILHSINYVCSDEKGDVKKLLNPWIQCWYHDEGGIDVDWRMELIDFVNGL